MYLKSLEIAGFKSFGKKVKLDYNFPISAIVGPNGSGKSNIAEAFRFVLGEQSIKSMRGKKGEDLIFNGTNALGKQSRASVKVSFDNSDHKLPIDFESVTLERIVNRDGSNEYKINNSNVRLKDIHELLASANIGSSGHHIISQGEADKILNSSLKEKKEMLEDALGLRIFQYKKNDSLKKLQKTEENIKEVESLKREITPHLKYLKKQVEKIQETKELKKTLEIKYKEYLKNESDYLKFSKIQIDNKIKEPKSQLEQIEKEITELSKKQESAERNEIVEEIKLVENKISDLNYKKSNLLRNIGRIEGEIDSLNRVYERQNSQKTDESISISKSEIENLRPDYDLEIIENYSTDQIKKKFTELVIRINSFIDSKIEKNNQSDLDLNSGLKNDIEKLKLDKEKISKEIDDFSKQDSDLRNLLNSKREELDKDKNKSLESERRIIELMSQKNKLQNIISDYRLQSDILERDENAFKAELTEAAVLVGRQVLEYENLEINIDIENSNRNDQITFKREIEKMKLKVEEFGVGNGDDVMQEYDEVIEREKFLIAEIEDMQKSTLDLNNLISELDEKINTKFKEGLIKINTQFQNFFSLMFGGGNASLKIVKINKKNNSDDSEDSSLGESLENTEIEEGVDIDISLPRKKIKGLMMLSGGERALTSIALLFAISQVNPPPFIILDETDAALDEANSKKYADMIENLSKHSQLILITHNRETMSRAGALYGVTMNQGISQILSIAFEDGEKFAK